MMALSKPHRRDFISFFYKRDLKLAKLIDT